LEESVENRARVPVVYLDLGIVWACDGRSREAAAAGGRVGHTLLEFTAGHRCVVHDSGTVDPACFLRREAVADCAAIPTQTYRELSIGCSSVLNGLLVPQVGVVTTGGSGDSGPYEPLP
jgi:hypothetical protein